MSIVHPIILTRAARAELIEAQRWYENEVPGLGRRFRAAVEEVIDRMTANPRQFPIVFKSVRRALLHRFPYALMFVIDADDTLLVIACFHGSRDPESWQRRV